MSNTRTLPSRASLSGSRDVSLASARRIAAIAALALLIVVAALLLWRRAAGSLSQPLRPLPLMAVALIVVAAAAGIRRSLRQLATQCSCWQHGLLAIAVSLAVLVLTFGLCVRGTPIACLMVVSAMVVAEEVWAWRGQLHRLPISPCPPLPKARQVDRRPRESTTEFPADVVVQQLTRSRAADGAEEISGWLRAHFLPGQRTASIHVAFCPPLCTAPELAVEQVDGQESRIKTAQILPYGARLDLKLATASDEPTSVLVEFAARA